MLKAVFSSLTLLLLLGGCSGGDRIPEDPGICVIPAPVGMEVGEGAFSLPGATILAGGEAEKRVAGYFQERIAPSTGLFIPVVESGEGSIILSIDPSSGTHPEGYRLTVGSSQVRIAASTETGLFYGVQTLLQLLPPAIDSPKRVSGVKWSVPSVSIEDYPRFTWRGFMIDDCRHFLGIDGVKKQIDILSRYKINTFHWHLTDDQGWRIEISKYPALTEVGAFRKEFDATVYGGFYTKDQIREVVRYAAARHITVVPEIEMPGHAMAAIRAYPHLSCEGKKIDTFYTWGTSDVVFCPGKESTFEFLEDVVAEVAELFPGPYIHVGGDECLKDKWAVCPDCQARIKAEGLRADGGSSAEEKLQSYAVRRMEGILSKYGKKLVGWNEILQGGLSPSATVMSWQGEKGGIQAAMQGNYVVMTPSHEGLYFDSYQGESKVEPLAFGRDIPLAKVYGYDPVPEVLKTEGKGNFILGVQANNWAEYMYSASQREYMLFPRAFALAEIAWTPTGRKDFEDFTRRADAALTRLSLMGVNFHIPIPQQMEGGSCDNLVFLDSARVAFSLTRPGKMVYTIDGKDPSVSSREYTEPFVLTEDATIKIRTVMPQGYLGPVRTVNVRKETPAPSLDLCKDDLRPGLRLRKTYGEFNTLSDIPADAKWEEGTIRELRELPTLEPRPRDMVGVRFYAAEAEGYFQVPSDGVWRFCTDDDQLWIDGKLLIDNGDGPKRYSRADAEMALSEGLHSIKVVFLSNVIGGWTSSRNKGTVLIKKPSDPDFRTLGRKDFLRDKD